MIDDSDLLHEENADLMTSNVNERTNLLLSSYANVHEHEVERDSNRESNEDQNEDNFNKKDRSKEKLRERSSRGTEETFGPRYWTFLKICTILFACVLYFGITYVVY